MDFSATTKMLGELRVPSVALYCAAFVGLWLTSGVAVSQLFFLTDATPIVQWVLRISWVSVLMLGLSLVFASRAELPYAFRANPALWGLVEMAWLSILWSPDASYTMRSVILLTISYLVGYVMAYGLRTQNAWWSVFGVLGLLLLSGAWLAIEVPSLGKQGEMWKGFFGQKNWFGYAAAIFTAVGVGLIGWVKARWLQVALLTLISFSVFFLYKSDSVTAIFACMAGLAAMGIAYGLVRRWVHWSFWLGLVVVVSLLFAFYAAELIAIFDRNPDLTGRWSLWKQLWPITLERPWLGYGYDAYLRADGVSERLGPWRSMLMGGGDTHNGFVRLMLDLGIVGVLLGVAVFVHLGCRSISWIQSGTLEPNQYLCIGIWALILVHQVAEPSMFMPGHYTMTLLVFTSLVSYAPFEKRKAELRQARD